MDKEPNQGPVGIEAIGCQNVIREGNITIGMPAARYIGTRDVQDRGNIDVASDAVDKFLEKPIKAIPESNSRSWHTTWWGVLALTIVGGLVIAAITYFLNWT